MVSIPVVIQLLAVLQGVELSPARTLKMQALACDPATKP